MKIFTSETQKTGQIGEDIAVKHLISKGFSIIDRNYTKKAGEIDIAARKGREIHFFEVKSSVSREKIRPEENMTRNKLQRLSRVTQIFFADHKELRDMDFFWNLIIIQVDLVTKKSRVEILEKINITV